MKTSDCYKDMITDKLDKIYLDKSKIDVSVVEDLRELFNMVLGELDKKDSIALERDISIRNLDMHIFSLDKQIEDNKLWMQNQDLLINGLNEQIERMTEVAR